MKVKLMFASVLASLFCAAAVHAGNTGAIDTLLKVPGEAAQTEVLMPVRPVPAVVSPADNCPKPRPGNVQDIITWINCLQLPAPSASNPVCVMPKPGAPIADVIAWVNCVQLPPSSSAIKAGTYRIRTGYTSGSIKIKPAVPQGSGLLEFSLFTVSGPTAHTADISGTARFEGGTAVFRDGAGCELKLEFTGPAVRVSGGDTTCRDYMGMRGAVDGVYIRE